MPESCRPPVFFVHVPSCGGTTLWEIFRQAYGAGDVLHLTAAPQDLEQYARISESTPEYFKHSVIGGHIAIPFAHTHFPTRRIITFLRHPVERATSVYHRRVRNGKWLPDPALGGRDILRFYEASNTKGTKYFWPKGNSGAPSVDDIKHTMDRHFCVVGLVEQFNLSLFLLSHELGWSEVPIYDQRNIGGNRPRHLSPMIAEELTAILACDMEIYEHGVAMFTAFRQKLPSSVEQVQLPAYELALARREAALLAQHNEQSPYIKLGQSSKMRAPSKTT